MSNPSVCFQYVIYDGKRDRWCLEFRAISDDVAFDEFSRWYNVLVRPSRWEKRKLGRYVLIKEGDVVDGKTSYYHEPMLIMGDLEVRLSFEYFWHCDPPSCPEDDVEIETEFKRLDDLDVARIERNRNSGALLREHAKGSDHVR